MEEKIIEAKYTVTLEEANEAYEFSGDQKERFKRNKNTTIWFVIIMLMFGFSIFQNLTSEATAQSKYQLYTYIAFEIICVVFIAVTWLGGRSIKDNTIASLANNEEIELFINQNGFSVKQGQQEEKSFEKGSFNVKTNENMFVVLTSDGEKLVIPKRIFDKENLELVSKYLV